MEPGRHATWPEELAVGEGGRLVFDGCDLAALAAERGTPLWVTSRTAIERNYGRFAEAFGRRWPRLEVAYAMKCNNTLAVVRLLSRCGALVDASAEYEVQLALAAGVPPGSIILNGNGKSDVALELAARIGVRQVNVDSLDEIGRLDAIAGSLGVRVPCLVRVQLTYEELLAEDPSFESTLRVGEGKFGVSLRSGEARAAVEAVAAAGNLDFLGLHHHVGFSGYMADYSPEREVGHHAACAREVCRFANELRRELGLEVRRLDLGGGFRADGHVLLSTPGNAADLATHPLPSLGAYADAIFGTLERELDVAEPPVVQFEPGGGQVAEATLMLVSVVEVKDREAEPATRFVTVDGSMMMFVSRGMMRVGHPVVPVAEPLRGPDHERVDVVGQTCVYDSIAEAVPLGRVTAGDVLALLHQGAYCETQSTQFNGFPRPESVLVHDGRVSVIRRRETLEDVRARDVVPPELWTS